MFNGYGKFTVFALAFLKSFVIILVVLVMYLNMASFWLSVLDLFCMQLFCNYFVYLFIYCFGLNVFLLQSCWELGVYLFCVLSI
jgi:hypothetical protein